jgi:hypothetical protein
MRWAFMDGGKEPSRSRSPGRDEVDDPVRRLARRFIGEWVLVTFPIGLLVATYYQLWAPIAP